jgi:hypothetical protein
MIVITAPSGEAGQKFRRLKLAAEQMSQLVVNVPGAQRAFIAIGFERMSLPSPQGTVEDYLYFKPDTPLRYTNTWPTWC